MTEEKDITLEDEIQNLRLRIWNVEKELKNHNKELGRLLNEKRKADLQKALAKTNEMKEMWNDPEKRKAWLETYYKTNLVNKRERTYVDDIHIGVCDMLFHLDPEELDVLFSYLFKKGYRYVKNHHDSLPWFELDYDEYAHTGLKTLLKVGQYSIFSVHGSVCIDLVRKVESLTKRQVDEILNGQNTHGLSAFMIDRIKSRYGVHPYNHYNSINNEIKI